MSLNITSTTDTPEAVIAANAAQVLANNTVEKEVEAEPSLDTKSETEIESKEIDDIEEDDSESSEEHEEETDSEESEDGKLEASKTGKNKGVRRRIKKLSQKLTDREKEIDYWKAEAMKNKTSDTPEESLEAAPERQSEVGDKPNPDEFDTHDEYIESLTDWKVEKKLSSRDQETREEKLRSEQRNLIDSHVSRARDFASKNADFDDVISDVDDIQISLTVQQAIISSENGPELMYELAKDKEEYARICSLPSIEAARALGRFEATLSSSSTKTKPKTVQTSNAPKPIAPLSSKGSGSGHKTIHSEGLSQREFERLREKQLSERATY